MLTAEPYESPLKETTKSNRIPLAERKSQSSNRSSSTNNYTKNQNLETKTDNQLNDNLKKSYTDVNESMWNVQKKILETYHNCDVAFKVMDFDNDGYIQFQDFYNLLRAKNICKDQTMVRNLFDSMDMDKDGRLSHEDLEKSFKLAQTKFEKSDFKPTKATVYTPPPSSLNTISLRNNENLIASKQTTSYSDLPSYNPAINTLIPSQTQFMSTLTDRSLTGNKEPIQPQILSYSYSQSNSIGIEFNSLSSQANTKVDPKITSDLKANQYTTTIYNYNGPITTIQYGQTSNSEPEQIPNGIGKTNLYDSLYQANYLTASSPYAAISSTSNTNYLSGVLPTNSLVSYDYNKNQNSSLSNTLLNTVTSLASSSAVSKTTDETAKILGYSYTPGSLYLPNAINDSTSNSSTTFPSSLVTNYNENGYEASSGYNYKLDSASINSNNSNRIHHVESENPHNIKSSSAKISTNISNSQHEIRYDYSQKDTIQHSPILPQNLKVDNSVVLPSSTEFGSNSYKPYSLISQTTQPVQVFENTTGIGTSNQIQGQNESNYVMNLNSNYLNLIPSSSTIYDPVKPLYQSSYTIPQLNQQSSNNNNSELSNNIKLDYSYPYVYQYPQSNIIEKHQNDPTYHIYKENMPTIPEQSNEGDTNTQVSSGSSYDPLIQQNWNNIQNDIINSDRQNVSKDEDEINKQNIEAQNLENKSIYFKKNNFTSESAAYTSDNVPNYPVTENLTLIKLIPIQQENNKSEENIKSKDLHTKENNILDVLPSKQVIQNSIISISPSNDEINPSNKDQIIQSDNKVIDEKGYSQEKLKVLNEITGTSKFLKDNQGSGLNIQEVNQDSCNTKPSKNLLNKTSAADDLNSFTSMLGKVISEKQQKLENTKKNTNDIELVPDLLIIKKNPKEIKDDKLDKKSFLNRKETYQQSNISTSDNTPTSNSEFTYKNKTTMNDNQVQNKPSNQNSIKDLEFRNDPNNNKNEDISSNAKLTGTTLDQLNLWDEPSKNLSSLIKLNVVNQANIEQEPKNTMDSKATKDFLHDNWTNSTYDKNKAVDQKYQIQDENSKLAQMSSPDYEPYEDLCKKSVLSRNLIVRGDKSIQKPQENKIISTPNSKESHFLNDISSSKYENTQQNIQSKDSMQNEGSASFAFQKNIPNLKKKSTPLLDHLEFIKNRVSDMKKELNFKKKDQKDISTKDDLNNWMEKTFPSKEDNSKLTKQSLEKSKIPGNAESQQSVTPNKKMNSLDIISENINSQMNNLKKEMRERRSIPPTNYLVGQLLVADKFDKEVRNSTRELIQPKNLTMGNNLLNKATNNQIESQIPSKINPENKENLKDLSKIKTYTKIDDGQTLPFFGLQRSNNQQMYQTKEITSINENNKQESREKNKLIKQVNNEANNSSSSEIEIPKEIKEFMSTLGIFNIEKTKFDGPGNISNRDNSGNKSARMLQVQLFRNDEGEIKERYEINKEIEEQNQLTEIDIQNQIVLFRKQIEVSSFHPETTETEDLDQISKYAEDYNTNSNSTSINYKSNILKDLNELSTPHKIKLAGQLKKWEQVNRQLEQNLLKCKNNLN